MKYIVTSPSRTGSTMLCQILNSAGLSVDHTHDVFYPIDNPSDTTLIFSLRRDLFSAIMSCLVGKRTNQFNLQTEETPAVIEPFSITCNVNGGEFFHQYKWHKWYADSHDLTRPLHRIETFYFEDFVNNHDHVYQRLSVSKINNVEFTQQTSHRARDLVINYDQCFETFNYLEKHSEFIPIERSFDKNLPPKDYSKLL